MNSIVIADDHPLLLRGLRDFLTSKGYNIIGVAEDGNAAYNLIVKLKPDLAILDIRMPFKTGLEIAEDCYKNRIKTKIILITFDQDEDLFQQAKRFNVFGYILKELAIEEIELCIQHAIRNESYFSKEIQSHLKTSKASDALLDGLTKTEKKVILLIAENKTSQEIAEILSVSIKTIHKHRSNIIAKIKLDNKPMSLTVWANLNKAFF